MLICLFLFLSEFEQAYTSVLYLRIPDNFRIVLRGHDVESHNVINDLMYPECVLYKPQIAGLAEVRATHICEAILCIFTHFDQWDTILQACFSELVSSH